LTIECPAQTICPPHPQKAWARSDRVGAEHLYTQYRAVIEQAIAVVCRRNALVEADADDFSGAINLHLIENDYAVLRKFQQRSSFRTLIVSVVSHQFQDWRNSRWGKWRSSAEARRQGAIAIHLERLLVRDGLSFEQAQETLRTNFQVAASRQELEAVAASLPARQKRQLVGEHEIEGRPASDGAPDEPIHLLEAAEAARHMCAALSRALADLAPQDRIVLRMRFEDDFSVMQIARALHLEPKPIYRRIERLLIQLRGALEREGVSAGSVADVLQTRAVDWMSDDGAAVNSGTAGGAT
jgi:RNA polymerase sigma factor (sigma-70 family)